jgi:hypothetical protein
MKIRKSINVRGQTTYDIECLESDPHALGLVVTPGNVFIAGFIEDDLTPEHAMELGAAIRLAGEAAKQLADGLTQTVLDLVK